MTRTKSRADLLNQVYRISEIDRIHNGIQWWCGVTDKNTERANNVWRIFMRYQRNIESYFGMEHLPNTFNLNKEQIYTKLPRNIYANF